MENENLLKVLLVEDEPNIAKLFHLYFVKAGYNCQIAINGRLGYETAKKFQPDIIVSDVMMPEVDGFEFRKLLLADAEVRDIPFVFLTAKGEEQDILNGYDLEIEDYLLKTASPKIVTTKVGAIIKSKGRERKKVVDELNKAVDNMGARVVPDEFPEFAGYDIRHWHIPFKNIPGGDFLDYIEVDEDNIVVFLGDVMGKRWGAWYFAVAYAGYVRSTVRVAIQNEKELNPGHIMNEVNKAIYRDQRISEVFTTLSIITLNKKTNTMLYSGAGDLPILYRKASDGSVTKIQSKGLLLGFSEEGMYNDSKIEMQPGDCVFLITDGITDSRDKNGEQFGTARLDDAIQNIPVGADALESVKNDFTAFTNNEFDDDITLMLIKAKE